MKTRLKSTLMCFALIVSYFAGSMYLPSVAGAKDFSELLEQRGDSTETSQSTCDTSTKKQVKISDFTDVNQNDWFYTNLDYLVRCGLINGKTQSTFEPYGSFSYAECSAVIIRYLGLEDLAKKCKAELDTRLPEYAPFWYTGYLSVLYKLGVFDGYGVFEGDGEKITSINTSLCDSPIERYRFAQSISKSFEPKGDIKLRNVYSEYGGKGRELILTGRYDENVLYMYTSKISDYEQIPENAKRDVLKAYYNGIFCGDSSGNFYPSNYITRCEMAKVLSTIADYSQRQRLIEDVYAVKIEDGMFHTDDAGVKTLDVDVWTSMLSNEAKGITFTGSSIQYTPTYNMPFGYVMEAYFYENSDDGYVLCGQTGMASDDYGTYTHASPSARILLVLRNVSEKSRPEGVYNVVIENGALIQSHPMIRQQ